MPENMLESLTENLIENVSENAIYNILEKIKRLPRQTEESLEDALGLIIQIEDAAVLMEWCRWVRREARALRTAKAYEVVRKTYFLGGKYNFDDFMIAMEWNREPKARFWLLRRKVLEGKHHIATQINYYNGVLPDGEPDNICFVNDVAWGGGDSLSMPIAYVYGQDVHIHDWVFDRRDKSCTKPRVVAKILQHKIKMGRTEANNGGDEYSDDVYRILREQHGYSINMSHKKAPTNMAKLTRIEQHAPMVRTYYFRSDKCRDDDYRKAMNELTGFSFTVKNVHDDAADSLAMLADYLANGIKVVSVGKRLF